MIILNNPVWGKLNYLSANKINAYMRCGIKFHIEYLNDMWPDPNINMIRGSSVHAAIEADNKYCIKYQERLDLDALIKIGIAYFNQETKKGFFISQKDIEDKDKLIDKAKNEVEIAIKLYCGMDRSWVPVSVEESLMEYIGYPLKMNIRMDLVDEDNVIREFKTGSKTQIRAVGVQDLVYCKTYEYKYGVKPIFQYVNFVLTKKPKVYIQTMPQHENYDILDRYVESYFNAIEHNVYLPGSDTDFTCSESSCPWYLSCDYKKQAVPVDEYNELLVIDSNKNNLL